MVQGVLKASDARQVNPDGNILIEPILIVP